VPDLWLPGSAQPSLEDFVERVHKRVERFAHERGEGQAAVEIELRDGSTLRLLSIDHEPGYGFLTLSAHREDGEPEELIVPVGAIARVTLRRLTEEPPFGFAAPATSSG
jgi:hypothetical protein